MLIGQLCKKAGVSKELIRHYEDVGLLRHQARQAGSRVYRHYDDNALERLRLIEKGKQVGLTLREIKPLLDAYFSGQLSKEEQVEILKDQIDRIDARIRQAEQTKGFIAEKLSRLLENTPCQCQQSGGIGQLPKSARS